jgi:hypothetical protein
MIVHQEGSARQTRRMKMTKQITKEKFDALAAANTVESETDVEYSYENVIDADGNEIAFATYRTGQEPVYTLRGE